MLRVIWLWHYLTPEVLGYSFGVSNATATLVSGLVWPVPDVAGRDTVRLSSYRPKPYTLFMSASSMPCERRRGASEGYPPDNPRSVAALISHTRVV